MKVRHGVIFLLVCACLTALKTSSAQPLNKSPEESLEFVRHVFAKDGILNTLIRDHLRVRRRSPVLRDIPLEPPTPNLIGKSKNDYGNFISNLLHMVRKRKYGDPVRVDLPTLGLCNRRTCADLYKYLDEFRQSDFFINMQTFFSLIQDEDGLDLILSVLGNPKLLQELRGPNGIFKGAGRGKGFSMNYVTVLRF